MGRITSNVGLITGTNISGTIDQLMKLAAVPRDRLVARQESLKAEQVVVNELTALVVGVQLQSTRLGSTTNISGFDVTSSNTDVLKATANGTGTAGSYRVRTVATAQSSSQTSSPIDSVNSTLSAGNITIRKGGFVDRQANLDSLRGGQGISRGKIEITNRAGESRIVDLRFAVTMGDVAEAINKTENLKVNARIVDDRLMLSDITGQAISNLKVSEVDGGRTAADLGFSSANVASNQLTGEQVAFLSNNSLLGELNDGRGISLSKGNDITITVADGTAISIDLNDELKFSRLGQVINAINDQNNGKFNARISADGKSLEIQDLTTGGGTLNITGKLSDSLGLTGKAPTGNVVTSQRLQSSLEGSLLNTLNGGKGLGSLGSLSITNRQGTQSTIDLSTADTLNDVIQIINDSSSGVIASLNRSKTGIKIVDTTGATTSNLIIAGSGPSNAAAALGIEANIARASVEGNSLNAQFISRQTSLASLNNGNGIALGSFTIKNSQGLNKTVNLASANAKTVGDVIDAINATAINVEAKLNDAGDGFVIVDKANGSGQLEITNILNGKAATELRIAGTSKAITVNGQSEIGIESNQNDVISVAAGETIEKLVKRIQDDPSSSINASFLNTGGSSVRIVMSSKSSGTAGRVYVEGDSVGITTAQSSSARDAVIAIDPTDNSGGTLISSSSNTFTGNLPGVRLEVSGVSAEVITVNSTKTFSRVESNLKLFVEQYNKVIDKLEKETAYDANTKTSGYLFGSSSALRIEQALSRLITSRVVGSNKIKSLAELGVNVSESGKLSLDASKLNKAIAEDPAAVEQFLSDKDNGFGARGKVVLENIVGVNNSLLINRNQTIQRQIEEIDTRVANQNVRLTRERQRLLKQFVGMEEAIAKIQANLNGLNLSVFDFNNSDR